jgi:hypothetical protein
MICKHGTSGLHTITKRIIAMEKAVATHRATRFPRSRSVRQREQWTHPVPHTPRTVEEEDRTSVVRRTRLQQREQGHTTLHSIDGGASLSPRSKSVVNSVSSRKPIQRSAAWSKFSARMNASWQGGLARSARSHKFTGDSTHVRVWITPVLMTRLR